MSLYTTDSGSIRFFLKVLRISPRCLRPGTVSWFDLVTLHVYKSNQVPENKQPFLPTLSRHISDTLMPVSDDPFDEVLRPPPNETPEQSQLRLSRESEAKRVSMVIDADIKAERQARRKKRIVRLLLLGQSESGEYHPFVLFVTFSVDKRWLACTGKSTTLRRKRTTFL